MSEASPQSVARRILVALDASPYGLAALEEAANLAAELRAELQGLFVEDVNLLRLACLPFVREITFSTAAPRQLDQLEMEQALRARADRIRQVLASRAHRASIEWSFEVTRGHVTRASLAAASEADVVFMGRESPTRAPAFLRSGPRRRPLVVLFDGSPSAYRVMDIAAQLARHQRNDLVVVIAASSLRQDQELRQDCGQWLNTQGLTAELDPSAVPDGATLCGVAGRRHARLLLINRDSPLLDEATIESLVNDLDCPLAMVP
jgi:nucleotide-binding universal stress UspA family protein